MNHIFCKCSSFGIISISLSIAKSPNFAHKTLMHYSYSMCSTYNFYVYLGRFIDKSHWNYAWLLTLDHVPISMIVLNFTSNIMLPPSWAITKLHNLCQVHIVKLGIDSIHKTSMTIISATLRTHTFGWGCEGATRYKECPFIICWLASANVGGMCQAANDHPLQLCMNERAHEQNNATGGRCKQSW